MAVINGYPVTTIFCSKSTRKPKLMIPPNQPGSEIQTSFLVYQATNKLVQDM